MIVPGPATRIFLAPGPTDLRRSFDGLHGLVLAITPRGPALGPSLSLLQPPAHPAQGPLL